MEQQTTPSMTGRQKRDLRKLLTDALDEMCFSNPAAQRVLRNGGRLKAGVKELLAKLSASDLLESVTTATIPAIPPFDVAAHFHEMSEEERKDAGVPIRWMNDDAKRLAKALAEPEPEVVETNLRVHKLCKASVDGPILAELGEQATTTWGQMYEMMRRQGRGQEGDLLVNGWANIFYIPDPDIEDKLWAVYCSWYSGCGDWGVYADPVPDPGTWDAAYRVVSR